METLPAGEYILVVDGNAGAECEWTFQSNTLLALILYNFSAEYNEMDDAVNIELELMSDQDREGIFVQRSINGIDFMDIDFIPSNYNAAEGSKLHNHSYSDNSYPLVEVVYYRLREIAYDGTVEYSNMRAVNLPHENVKASVLQDVHPNPAEDLINIPFYINSEDAIISADIYDMQGRLLMNIAKDQSYSNGKQRFELNVAHLPRGVYMLRFTANEAVSIRKFVLR